MYPSQIDRANAQTTTDGTERGISSVLGLVLVLGMVIAASMVIVIVGATTFQQSQSTVSMESAVTAMEELNAELQASSGQSEESVEVSMPAASSNLRYEKEGWINISVINQSGSIVHNHTIQPLGKLVYEQDEQSVTLQAGGVWRQNNDNSAALITKPDFEYQYQQGDPTLTMSIIQLDKVNIDGKTVRIRQTHGTDQGLVSANPLEPGQTLRVTVHSEFYKSWGDIFRSHELDPKYSAAKNEVHVNLTAPPQPVRMTNAITVPGTVGLGGGITIQSYDSRTTPGTGTVGLGNYRELDNGDVFATDGGSGFGGVTVEGDLYFKGDFSTAGGATVNGDIYATGNVTVGNDFSGTIVSGGNITVSSGGVTFGKNSSIRAAGDLIDHNNGGNHYKGDVHVGGKVVIDGGGSGLDSTGSITAGGTVTLSNNNGGAVIENASVPSLGELDRIGELQDMVPDPSQKVATKVSQLRAVNDNDTAVFSNFTGGSNAHDYLTAGSYYYDGDLTYSGNPSLTFDTTGGDIYLAVNGTFDAASLDMEVKGDNHVYMYVTGHADISGGGEFTNTAGRGDQFWLYTADDSTQTKVQANAFYGVILSDSKINIGGGTPIYGALLSPDAGITGGQNIYYDERLAEGNIYENRDFKPGTVSYVRVE